MKTVATMLLTKKVFKTAFIEALNETGLTVYFHRNTHFILIKENDSNRIVSVELIYSTKIDPVLHGSHNNNTVFGIGHFKFNIPKTEDKINYYAFALLNTTNRNIEFVIVPDTVLRSRFQNQNLIPEGSINAELTLWLINGKVYDATNLSMEGEWYFMSSAMGGRMSDGSGMDYTEFLHHWNQLNDSLAS